MSRAYVMELAAIVAVAAVVVIVASVAVSARHAADEREKAGLARETPPVAVSVEQIARDVHASEEAFRAIVRLLEALTMRVGDPTLEVPRVEFVPAAPAVPR